MLEIPCAIGCLHQLKILDVSNNQVESLPTQISNLRLLEQLHLQYNKIDKFHKNITTLKFVLVNCIIIYLLFIYLKVF